MKYKWSKKKKTVAFLKVSSVLWNLIFVLTVIVHVLTVHSKKVDEHVILLLGRA